MISIPFIVSVSVVQWYAYQTSTQEVGVQFPSETFTLFFHFFQTLGAKKGHTRHVLPCLLYTTELCIIQRSFWHRSDSYAMICKILTLVREIRHFWRYFMSFSYFLPSQNFCYPIRASYPLQKPVLRQKNKKIRIILKGPPNNCAT